MLAANPIYSAWAGSRDAVDASVQTFPEFLAGVQIWQLVFFVALGLVSLLYGLKLFKGMVAIYAAMAGVVMGGAAALWFGAPELLGAVVGAVVLAVLAWPLLKVAVSVFGGVAGGLAGAMCVLWLDDPVYVLIAGIAGLVIGFVLGFLVFRGVIVFTTATLGAMLVVLGIVGLVMAVPSAREAVIAGIQANRHWLPLLVGVSAAIGAAYQAVQSRGETKKGEKK
jgi:hypothetical protein